MAINLKHEITHHHYTLFSTAAEFMMAFSLHFLPTFHVGRIAETVGLGTFAIYAVVSAMYFRRSLATERISTGR